MTKSIIYIANYLSDKIIEERNNREFLSPAANNKIISIAKSFKSVGYKVIIISPGLTKNNTFRMNTIQKEIYEEGIEIIYPEGIDANVINRMFSIYYQLKLIRQIMSQEDIQAILFYDFIYEMAYPAFISKFLYKKKLIVDYEEELYSKEQPFSLHTLLLYLTRKFIANKVDGAILVSSTLKRFIKTQNYCICRGFYDNSFDEDDKHYNIFEKYVLSDKKVPTIVFGGKMDSFRGIDILLESVNYIKHKCKLILTGYGPDMERLRIAADRIKSSNVTIDFKGFVTKEEYKKLILEGDILINTQRIDSELSGLLFPSKIIEYMSTGNIVVSSNISDVSKIGDEKIVLYYKDSPQDIADALNEVMGNIEKYASYGNNAKYYCKRNYNYIEYGKEFLKLLKG